MFEKCEFCEKYHVNSVWDFLRVNFVKNEILKIGILVKYVKNEILKKVNFIKNEFLKIVNSVQIRVHKIWILSKIRISKCEFCENWYFLHVIFFFRVEPHVCSSVARTDVGRNEFVNRWIWKNWDKSVSKDPYHFVHSLSWRSLFGKIGTKV